MCSGVINWSGFSWEAFATLVTGFLAVLGAVVVGLRQAAILRKQADLQERSVKEALFDRRYAVLERTERFLGQILQRGDRSDQEVERDFLIAKGEARFLFGNTVTEGLDLIWRDAGDLIVLKREMETIFRREGHYGDGNPDRELNCFRAVENHFRAIPDLFNEMKLG